MKYFLIFTLLVSLLLSGCGDEEETETLGSFSQSWDVQLNGADFNVERQRVFAFYQSSSDELIVVGTKNVSTDERLVLTFSIADGSPFAEQSELDMGNNSGNSILYFDGNGNQFSSLNDQGSGQFRITRYVDTNTGDFISGTIQGQLYSESMASSVTVSGTIGVKAY